MKCAGNSSCPFPPLIGEEYCREHFIDQQMPLTLHEISGSHVRKLEEEGDLWRGFRKDLRPTLRPRGRPVELNSRRSREKMNKEEREKRNKYANTYCQGWLPPNPDIPGSISVRCNTPIPIDERICDSCKERLLPTKPKAPSSETRSPVASETDNTRSTT